MLVSFSGSGVKRSYSMSTPQPPDPLSAYSGYSNGVDGRFDYEGVDPFLSPEQLNDYRQSESEWRAVLSEVGGPVMFGQPVDSQKPTFRQFETLRRLLEQRTDIKLNVLPGNKKSMRNHAGFTKFSKKDNLPVISFYLPDPSNQTDVNDSFTTLSHEFLHGLHYNRASIRPTERRASFDICTSLLEESVSKNCDSRTDWQTLFHQNRLLCSEMGQLNAKNLSGLKIKLMTEAVAYQLTSLYAPRESFDKQMADGYKAAIRFVNSQIETRLYTQPLLEHQAKRQRK